MSIANKTFKNNKTGETIKVIDSFENIAILENKQKIDVRTLMDSNQYTEQIDPNQFFNNQGAYNSLFEKIKTIPTNHINDDDDGNIKVNPSTTYDSFGPVSNESAIIMTTEEDEKAELARKYGVNPNPIEATSRQNEAFAKLLGEDAENELPTIARPVVNEPVQRIEINRDIPEQNYNPVQQVTSVEDPILTMFKRTKRNVEFKINVEISDKIPRLDFIEMMEDSYEISMIDFLADEFTNKILQDPSTIRETIKSKIKQLVYGAPTTLSSNFNTTNKDKKETKKDSKNIQTVNDQITDSVTQVEKNEPLSFEKEPVLSKDLPKKTTTRKPRAKKESDEK
jgi:type III secretion system FlhB-like substrate exporter